MNKYLLILLAFAPTLVIASEDEAPREEQKPVLFSTLAPKDEAKAPVLELPALAADEQGEGVSSTQEEREQARIKGTPQDKYGNWSLTNWIASYPAQREALYRN